MTSPTRQVVLVSGSSGNHVLAADLGRRSDWQLHLVTTRPESWAAEIECVEHQSRDDVFPYLTPQRHVTYRGRLASVTPLSKSGDLMRTADLILLTCPVHAHRPLLERIVPALDPAREVLLGTTFAQGGFDWVVRDVARGAGVSLEKVGLFGLQHFPFLCKKQEYGRRVLLLGRFPDIRVAMQAPNRAQADAILAFLRDAFGKPVTPLPGFLCCTLSLSNQILHPAITWALFRDYVPGGEPYPRCFAFYGECDADGAGLICDMAFEVRALARRLDGFAEAGLYDHHVGEGPTRLSLRLYDRGVSRLDRIRPLRQLRNRSLAWLYRHQQRLNRAPAPMSRVDGRGYVPDFGSRFWLDDIPHGLCVLHGLARILDVPVPVITRMIHWHQERMGKAYLGAPVHHGWPSWGPALVETNAPQRYGITTPDQLRSFLAAPHRPAC